MAKAQIVELQSAARKSKAVSTEAHYPIGVNVDHNLKGWLLASPPQCQNTWFEKTVILIYDHSRQGALGVCINKPDDSYLSQMLSNHHQVKDDIPIFVGGPINQNIVLMLHSSEWQTKNSQCVGEDLCLTSDPEMIGRLIAGDRPHFYRMFKGLSSWGKGQLEGEIAGKHPWNRSHSWVTMPAKLELVWETESKDIWQSTLDAAAAYTIDQYF